MDKPPHISPDINPVVPRSLKKLDTDNAMSFMGRMVLFGSGRYHGHDTLITIEPARTST